MSPDNLDRAMCESRTLEDLSGQLAAKNQEGHIRSVSYECNNDGTQRMSIVLLVQPRRAFPKYAPRPEINVDGDELKIKVWNEDFSPTMGGSS